MVHTTLVFLRPPLKRSAVRKRRTEWPLWQLLGRPNPHAPHGRRLFIKRAHLLLKRPFKSITFMPMLLTQTLHQEERAPALLEPALLPLLREVVQKTESPPQPETRNPLGRAVTLEPQPMTRCPQLSFGTLPPKLKNGSLKWRPSKPKSPTRLRLDLTLSLPVPVAAVVGRRRANVVVGRRRRAAAGLKEKGAGGPLLPPAAAAARLAAAAAQARDLTTPPGPATSLCPGKWIGSHPRTKKASGAPQFEAKEAVVVSAATEKKPKAFALLLQ